MLVHIVADSSAKLAGVRSVLENRRYRQPMSRAEAYGILCGMHGKLEKPLVAAFKDVALSR
jgi:hypothetical protein